MSTQRASGGNRFGCFTYGCGFALVLITVLFGGLGYYYVNSLRAAFEEYSAERVPALPPFEIDSAVIDGALAKLSALRVAISNKSAGTHEFTQGDVNALISRSSARDAVRVSLGSDEISAQFAFTPALFGEWRAAELVLGNSYRRFFNGSSKAKVAVANGIAKVTFTELTLNGHTLEDMARGHASQWVTGAVNSAADGEAVSGEGGALQFVRSLEVRDGRVVVEVGEIDSGTP